MNIVGHRGASACRPENSPIAFTTADEMGADGVELDVRLAETSDGSTRLVIYHDPLPADPALAELLPTFDQVLDACGERMLVNVEIKNSESEGGHDPTMAVVAPTIAAMRARGDAWAHRWLFSSFDLDTIDECRRQAPEIPTAYLVEDLTDDVIAAAADGGHVGVHPWVGRLDAERVAAAHAAGLIVNVWTCNEVSRLAALDELGVDGVCTDMPDFALVALGRRGTVAATPRWGRRA